MDYELVQLAALASGANAVLAKWITPASFYPSHWVFAERNRVSFDPLDGKKQNRLRTPNEWIRHLGTNGISRIQLSEPRRSQINNDWMLQATVNKQPIAWTRDLLHGLGGERLDCDHYRLVPGNVAAQAATADELDKVVTGARKALKEIHDFAVRHNLGFESCFQKGLDALGSTSPLSRCRYHPLVAARRYPLCARQLMAAACHSWVFGGMGSWSDYGFSDRRKMKAFNRVTDQLVTALVRSMQFAVNLFPQE